MDFFLHIVVLIGGILPSILGFNLVFGKGKILHFGGLGASVAIGYIFVLSTKSTESIALGLLFALCAAIVISLFFAWLSLRLEADAMGVMSIAVHLSVIAVILNWNSVTRGALGVPGVPRPWFLQSISDFAILATVVAVLSLIVFWKIDRSVLGRQISALAEHEWHAKSLGIHRGRVHVWAFILLGIMQVVSNFVYLPYLTFLHPNDYLFPALVFWVMVGVAGGAGNIKGVSIATVLLICLKEAMRLIPMAPSVLGPMRLILFGFILLAVVYWRRDTLFPKQRSI